MKIGLVGLPSTGKTTFFQLLTESVSPNGKGRTDANIGTAEVPDDKIDYVASVYKPEQIINATIEVIDVQGLQPADSNGKSSSAHFLEAVRQVDALVHVVRAFEDDSVYHIEGDIDPLRDIEIVNLELLFADLAVIENRIERIEATKKVAKEHLEELELIKRCKECLENGDLLYSMDLNDEERKILRTYNFLTERPLILLINMDEDQFLEDNYKDKEKVLAYAKDKGIPLVNVSAKIELEISELEEEDYNIFMEDLGIEKPGINRLAEAAYDLLGLVSFITAGPRIVKAWPIRRNTTAKEAGGKIHSDIERGFIRAEVAKFEDFKKYGSMQELKEHGLVKLEGKDAIIEDGDIINFRFNV
ncbi:MAG: redox-regulated ATPase YchF [Clostridiales bacterium]|nr:redox-regulated ATPase YchF [Clostridiales bacterium]